MAVDDDVSWTYYRKEVQQRHHFRGSASRLAGSGSPYRVPWTQRIEQNFWNKFVPKMSQPELDLITVLNGVLFTSLQPFFDKMMQWDRKSQRPVCATSFDQFITKGMQPGLFRIIFQHRGNVSQYTNVYQWIDAESARLAALGAIRGLCERGDKRNLTPLYRVLGHGHEFDASALAWRVAVKFVSTQSHLDASAFR